VRAAAVLPVKRFGAAKSRLAASAIAGARPEVAAAMVADVLAALSRSREIERVLVVSGEPRARAAAADAGAEWLDDPDDRGHSEAASLGVAAALAAGAVCAALLPGDCPLLDASELDEALGGMAEGIVAVIPDRHGSGTNGLLLSPPDAIAPAFGPGSRKRHLRLAAEAGHAGRVAELPSLALDLDTPDDLAAMSALLAREPERAPATARALAAAETARP
jgi:2-phospho-L-lactate guanylyltransferase